jgi:hypothetical protein
MRSYRRDGGGAIDPREAAALREAISRAAPKSDAGVGARSWWVESPFGALLVVEHQATGSRPSPLRPSSATVTSIVSL